MSGLQRVDCTGCGRRYETSAEQARKERVLRCACGRFLRLDRAISEPHSDPAPAARAELASSGDDDERTHLLDSLAAVASLHGRTPSRPAQPSLHEPEARPSRPVTRAALHSLPPAPGGTPAPSRDKPLWYVDLGGSETVEMTIEQLIIARRSGKLGEGALVWREGMPRWRPVGTLIPAAGAAARSTPLPPPGASVLLPSAPPMPPRSNSTLAQLRPASAPPAPKRTAPPPPPSSRTLNSPPESLASYERPVPTLEFALGAAGNGTTPLPNPATWNRALRAPQPGHGSVAARLPLAPPAVPKPAAPPPRASTTDFNSVLPSHAPVEVHHASWLTDAPRWRSVGIALALCIVASGSGAILVRSLRLHRQPLALATSVAAQPAPPVPAPAVEVPGRSLTVLRESGTPPLVVDLESLTVEHTPPRVVVRSLAAPIKPPSPSAPASSEGPSTESASAKPSDSALPDAAQQNPYGSAGAPALKAPPSSSDASGL